MGNALQYGTEIVRKALPTLVSNCPVVRSLNHEYEKKYREGGYEGQKQYSLSIRKPMSGTVRTTWPISVGDRTENVETLTVNTVRGIDLQLSDAELAQRVDDIYERLIQPDVEKLASHIEAYAIDYMLDRIANNVAYTSLAVPTALTHGYLDMGAKIKAANVGGGPLNMVISPLLEANIIGGLAGQYNPTGNISTMFEKGQMSKAAGFNWYMSQNMPGITIGSQANSDDADVGTFSTSAKTSLPYVSSTTSGTTVVGQTITIAGLYDINFESKVPTSQLKQFVVTAANTASGGAGTLTVWPEINFLAASADQNCYISGESIDGVDIRFGCLLGTTAVATTASATYQQAMAFHRDSFAFASLPLMIPKSAEAAGVATDDRTGISIRFVRDWDQTNARITNRLDCYFGMTKLYPQWACKLWTV
jgi:hypothetical protein